jgi:hypothetical protein
MKQNKTIGYICVMAIALIATFGLFISHANAATDFMVSWQTRTYAPDWYIGKALPTYQSFIDVQFELIEDGKVADLSKAIVRWYVDDKLFKNEDSGLGIKKFTVYNQKYGGVTSVKISLPEYKGAVLEKTIDIPVKNPEVVIDIPFFEKRIPKGESKLFAWPFFFNTLAAGNLSLQWTVDGTEVKQQRADVSSLLFTVGKDMQAGERSMIKATVVNQRKASEAVQKEVLAEIL